jgi:hypothetical protein
MKFEQIHSTHVLYYCKKVFFIKMIHKKDRFDDFATFRSNERITHVYVQNAM